MANMTQFDSMREVDEIRAVARSADEVLALTLPLKAKSSTRKIAVS